MDIASYASNIQPFSSSSGTEIASKNTKASEVPLEADSQTVVRQAEASSSTESDKLAERQAAEVIQRMAAFREDLNESEREKMVEKIGEFLTEMNTGLSFRTDEDSGRDIVTVYAKDSGDIIRQIPNEELLDVLNRLERHGSMTIDMMV
ncbi:flagellar protein FlaG [Vibrio hippocampi]|uniref:Flagellar biosynthesis protein FlaG n=1 Tax=Vibrio hippocampi TaxID=654686 RepID=A0ABN8DE23_9VIBR|nr:flagellar protein FlaG [Vibrio hippocampi]CAH0525162.1 hypothetical protein VHP8226_00829 [Vibrio hippocampi]